MTMRYHAIATLAGGRQKTLPNKTEEQMLAEVVIPFVNSGTVTAKWGVKTQTYQVLEMKIFRTTDAWDKKAGPLNEHTKNKKNVFNTLREKAEALLANKKHRIFMVTPIQGNKHGDQEQQRILREYNERFETIEKVVSKFGGVAIRIDQEQALEDLVTRIKREIRNSAFIIADLTDERQSCYFEAGYAEALRKPVIYCASQNSVMKPGTPTKIHFDIHMNVQFFTNQKELSEKIEAVILKNREKLFPPEGILEEEAGALIS